MSSLRNIMDVDVEPLPQSLPREYSTPDGDLQLTPSNHGARRENQAKSSKRRKSSRSRKASASEESSPQGRSSANVAPMDPNRQETGHRNTSVSSSTRRSSKNSDVPEGSLKYTPVTGRVSRAKKGQRVHICDLCKPSKTFTRAEHLRRHQLSHTEPAFPCTFPNCDRAFYRPDLLTRHMHRHETQGEKPCKATSSRASSVDSSSKGSPMLRLDVKSNDPSTSKSTYQRASTAPTEAISNRASTATMKAEALSVEHRYLGNRHHELATVGVGAIFGESADPPDDLLATMHHSLTPSKSMGSYHSSALSFPQHIPTTYQFGGPLPSTDDIPTHLQLQIPEPPFPGLSIQENSSSSWYGSDSPYSTSSDVTGASWEYRIRSASVCTDMEYAPPTTPWDQRASLAQRHSLRGRSSGNIFDKREESVYSNAATHVDYEEGSVRRSRSSHSRMHLRPHQLPKAMVSCEPMNHGYAWRNAGFQGQLDEYLSAYWRFFDGLWPIIHPATFNPDARSALRFAMAAIGTQFFGRAKDREHGSELHRECKRLLALCFAPEEHTMQAILLTEIFAKFRSQRVDTQPSKAFKALYDYLIKKVPSDDAGPFSSLDSDGLQALLATEAEADLTTSPQTRIHRQWIAYEIRQRLRSACLMFDEHQTLYHEPSTTRRSESNVPATRIIFPCPSDIWLAKDATEWCAKITAKGTIEEPSAANEMDRSHYKNHLLICSLLSILPHRDLARIPHQSEDDDTGTIPTGTYPHPIIAHAYLQFYHAPLRDILTIAGDTWVFGRKITTQADFEAAKARLHAWSASAQAARATWHACHVLQLALTGPTPPPTAAPSHGRDSDAVCAYWSVYTATLICWAFGHRKAHGTAPLDDGGADADAAAAKTYVDAVTRARWRDLLGMSGRGAEVAVVRVVRARLELEAVGGKCGMLVDATAVLSRISEGRGGLWF